MWRRSQSWPNHPLVGTITGNFEFWVSKSACAPIFFPDYSHFPAELAILGTANSVIHNSEFEISNSEKALDSDVPRDDDPTTAAISRGGRFCRVVAAPATRLISYEKLQRLLQPGEGNLLLLEPEPFAQAILLQVIEQRPFTVG